MRSVASLGIHQIRERRGRSALAVVSVALGVAAIAGVQIGTATAQRAISRFEVSLDSVADVVAEPIGSVNALISDETAAAIASRPGVERAFGVHDTWSQLRVLDASSPPADEGEPRYKGIASVIPYVGLSQGAPDAGLVVLDEGRMPAPGAPEVAVSSVFAGLADVAVGDRVEIGVDRTAGSVVGIVGGSALSGDGGVLVVTSLETAQALSGGAGGLTRMLLTVAEGIDPASVLPAGSSGPPGVRFEVAGSADNGLGDFLAGMSAIMQAASAMALVVAGYLIYLSFSTTVLERTAVYGSLRAIGATRSHVMAVVVAEAAVLGIVGAALGVVAGLAIGELVARVVSPFIGVPLPGRVVPVGSVAVAALLGVATPVLSVLGPARRAATVDPAVAVRGAQALDRRPSRAWIPGLAMVAVGLSGAALADQTPPVAFALLMWGAALLVPPLLPALARAVRPLLARLAPGVGDVAVRHLVGERSRSAYTAALLMVSVVMVLSLAAVNDVQRPAFLEYIEAQWASDVSVHAAPAEARNAAGFSSDDVATVAATPGVAAVAPVGFGRTEIVRPAGGAEHLLVIDPTVHFDVAGFLWSDGVDQAHVQAALAAGGSVVLPQLYAEELGIAPGDTVELATGTGPRPFTVAGTYATFGFGESRSLVVGAGDGAALFGMSAPGTMYVRTVDGADPDRVEDMITGRLETGGRDVIAWTGDSARERGLQQLDGIYGVFLVVLGIAVLVALLGLANTMVTSVVSRTREIGVLRALGIHAGELVRMVVAESLALTVSALAAGALVTAAMAWLLIDGVSAGFGATLPYRYPWRWLPFAAAALVSAGVLAALVPARRAARVDPVVALRSE